LQLNLQVVSVGVSQTTKPDHRRRLVACTAVEWGPQAVFETNKDGTFSTGISKDGDGVSALSLSPRP
jgi:hypothetical protein